MGRKIKSVLPPIGWRILKSAAAVLLCYLVSFLRGNSGIVFYSQLAALWCIQMYAANSRKNASQRFIGTVIGALYGLVYLLLRNYIQSKIGSYEMADAFFISGLIIVIIYTTVLLKKKDASYFSCVVFLSIVVNHVTDANPYLFVWNRFLDTVIGIFIGVGVNSISLPREKRRDILFISGLDDTLLNQKDSGKYLVSPKQFVNRTKRTDTGERTKLADVETGINIQMSDYSRVELNRMLDDGIMFTISTVRTPASLMEPMRDIRLKLPVIAMDGAVLYDIQEKRYLKVYVISNKRAIQVLSLVKEAGLSCFSNVIIDDMLVIYYENMTDEIQKNLIAKMRRSPYRNYVNRKLPEQEKVVYFMLLYPKEVIEKFYTVLENTGITQELKVIKYDFTDVSGYACIKIYNKNASKENMIRYLRKMTGIEKTITFGSIAGRYDIVVEPGDSNKVVRMLKKLYEPVKKSLTGQKL